MRRDRSCLGAISAPARRLLGLRAGLEGAPLTRPEAARSLGISRRSAARLERSGLRELHVACGSGSGGGASPGAAPRQVADLTSAAPSLQPAALLPVSAAPHLRPASDLSRPRGKRDVKGATASSAPPAADDRPVQATVELSSSDNSDGPGLAITMAVLVVALMALTLVALRRRAVVMSRGRSASTPDVPMLTAPAATTGATAASAAPAATTFEPSQSVPTSASRPSAEALRSNEEADAVQPTLAPAVQPAPPTRVRMRPRDPRRLARIAAERLRRDR